MASTEEPPTKKSKTNGHDESKDEAVLIQSALEEIESCQNELDGLNEKASEEILEVEQKYNKERKPFFTKRNDIIQSIPNFWITAFVNHPQLSAILEESEEEALHHLTKLEVEESDDVKSGYNISFHFAYNPFFENGVLVKEYHIGASGEPCSSSTKIKWREGKDLLAVANKREAESLKAKRPSAMPMTFFQWFTDNSDPTSDDIAEVIKDDAWPNPLQYYLAPDIEMDPGDEEDLEDEGDEEDEEEDDGDEDEAEEEDEEEGEAGKEEEAVEDKKP